MNSELFQNKIRIRLNEELIRRMLIQYFSKKGFNESFNKHVYPPQILDLPNQIPQFLGKIEVVPFAEDINPQTGVVKLGWNMFVLGNKRMFLGYTSHTSMSEIQSAIAGPLSSPSVRCSPATPKSILEFIIKVMGSSVDGDIASIPKSVNFRASLTPIGVGDSGNFFKTGQKFGY